MGKIFVVLLSFFVIAAFPVVSFAQEHTVTTTAEEQSDTSVSNTTRPQPRDVQTANPRVQATDRAMEARDAMAEKISEARMEFAEKVQEVADEVKQTILENIVNRINESNQKRTMLMEQRLERLSSILSKISEKATDLAEDDVNVTALNRLITNANTAIEDAKESVAAQMEKEYIVDITTESALRANARSTIREYITDIKGVHQDVVAAHRAVVQAFSEANSLNETEDDTLESDTTTE